jgi:hypothetical protein
VRCGEEAWRQPEARKGSGSAAGIRLAPGLISPGGRGSALRLISAARGAVPSSPMPHLAHANDALIAAAPVAVVSVVQVLVAPIAPRPLGVVIALAHDVRSPLPHATTVRGRADRHRAVVAPHRTASSWSATSRPSCSSTRSDRTSPTTARRHRVCAFALDRRRDRRHAPDASRSSTTSRRLFAIVVGPDAPGPARARQREQAERLRELTDHWSASASDRQPRSPRSGRGSRASCTTSSPTA